MRSELIGLLLMLTCLSAGAAEDCFYCWRIEKTRDGFSKVLPDPMNIKTLDRQEELVTEAIDIAETVIAKRGKKLTNTDIERLVTILAIATPYDNSNTIGEALLEPFAPFHERISAEIARQEKKGIIKAALAETLRTEFALAEKVKEVGNDDVDADEKASGETISVEKKSDPTEKSVPKKK